MEISHQQYTTASFGFVGIWLPILTALIATAWIHPLIVKLATRRHMTDNPNPRKLHTRPIPVLGGLAVYFGILAGAGITSFFLDTSALLPYVVAMTVMMFIGMLDDLITLTPWTRLIFELLIIAFLMLIDHVSINSLHGAFGIGTLPLWCSIPLTAVACCGIINAINLMDGIDGLSSGFGFLASICFGLVFVMAGDFGVSTMVFLAAGALVPFWFHNVFGKTSKMFIGDSGTLMMGTLMSICTMHVIDSNSLVAERFPTMGVVAFALSLLSQPVFDTVRVMIGRIRRHTSPFHADKTHLHHLFIDLDMSHLGATISLLTLNTLNLICWFLTWQLGGGPTLQLIVVVVIGTINTFGVAYMLQHVSHHSRLYKRLALLAVRSNKWMSRRTFTVISRFVDKH